MCGMETKIEFFLSILYCILLQEQLVSPDSLRVNMSMFGITGKFKDQATGVS